MAIERERVELVWAGKDERRQPDSCVLIEDPVNSYGDTESAGNRLIRGDNLPVLLALESELAGQVTCVYIDPPYNTGGAQSHYADGLAHAHWLSLLRDRLTVLHRLLRPDGFLFLQIDHNEMAYAKVLLDELFGRGNAVNDIVWKRRGGSANPRDRLDNVTDSILWYAKTPGAPVNPVFTRDDEKTRAYIRERFTNLDERGRRFMKSPLQSPNPRPNLIYDYKGYRAPAKGWSISREVMERWDREGKLCFPADTRRTLTRKIYLDEYPGQPVSNLWTDIPVINPMAGERLGFDGQKPEALLRRILTLATQPGDLVLDCYAGSGTTGAVAHKLGRHWIMIEQGEQARTVIVPRLIRVIDGRDPHGITRAVDWQGGGGFRAYRLSAPPGEG